MKILLDNCTPGPLRKHLTEHTVIHAAKLGWAALSNGDLLKAADAEFDLFITCDQNLRYQQNLTGRRIAILELRIQFWPELELLADQIASAVAEMQPGEYRILF